MNLFFIHFRSLSKLFDNMFYEFQFFAVCLPLFYTHSVVFPLIKSACDSLRQYKIPKVSSAFISSHNFVSHAYPTAWSIESSAFILPPPICEIDSPMLTVSISLTKPVSLVLISTSIKSLSNNISGSSQIAAFPF